MSGPKPPKTVEEWRALSPEEQDALIASGWHPGPLPRKVGNIWIDEILPGVQPGQYSDREIRERRKREAGDTE